jgi:hypothetical protein
MRKDRRCVVGIRMTPERGTELKGEAACRGLSVADLFEEMWTLYRNSRREAGDDVER